MNYFDYMDKVTEVIHKETCPMAQAIKEAIEKPDAPLFDQKVTADNCPNHSQHISSFPDSTRELCPRCRTVYVRKVN